MASKYEDATSATQVIGGIAKMPELLDETGRYFFRAEDFPSELHRAVFMALTTIYANGGSSFTAKAVDDVLSAYPNAYATYKASRGNEWFSKVLAECDIDNFDLYYNRLKKMTLLREYENSGVDMSGILDMDELDPKKRQEQQAELDEMTVTEVSDVVELRLSKVRTAFVDNADKDTKKIGDGLGDLIQRLRSEPEFGVPLYGPFVNTVTMGARLTKFYLRSAPTGVGKTRMMIADACNVACDEIYDTHLQAWKPNGVACPSLYISTELELSEVQTMCIAFLSGVSEDKILGANKMTFGEKDRVSHAIEVLDRSPLYIDIICDFTLKDIENSIRRNHRENKVLYVFYDYIMTTMKILEEITSRSRGVNLREDNILFMISNKLKDIANDLGIFILSSTQTNSGYKTDPVPDQSLLRGAKSIADKIDVGMIALDVTEDDREKIGPLLNQFGVVPNVKMSVYKNRRGAYNRIFLWMYADKGTCRYETLFATDFNYQPIVLKECDLLSVRPDEEEDSGDEDVPWDASGGDGFEF